MSGRTTRHATDDGFSPEGGFGDPEAPQRPRRAGVTYVYPGTAAWGAATATRPLSALANAAALAAPLPAAPAAPTGPRPPPGRGGRPQRPPRRRPNPADDDGDPLGKRTRKRAGESQAGRRASRVRPSPKPPEGKEARLLFRDQNERQAHAPQPQPQPAPKLKPRMYLTGVAGKSRLTQLAKFVEDHGLVWKREPSDEYEGDDIWIDDMITGDPVLIEQSNVDHDHYVVDEETGKPYFADFSYVKVAKSSPFLKAVRCLCSNSTNSNLIPCIDHATFKVQLEPVSMDAAARRRGAGAGGAASRGPAASGDDGAAAASRGGDDDASASADGDGAAGAGADGARGGDGAASRSCSGTSVEAAARTSSSFSASASAAAFAASLARRTTCFSPYSATRS